MVGKGRRTRTSRGRMGDDMLLESLANDVICVESLTLLTTRTMIHVRHSKMNICQPPTYLSVSTADKPIPVLRMLSNSSQQESRPSHISRTRSESTERPRSARRRASRPVSAA